MESECGSIEVSYGIRHTSKLIPSSKWPSNYFEEIEVFDSSCLTNSLIEILELIERTLLNKNGIIDIVTQDCILTEFLQRALDLVNRRMITCKYYLKMENRDDGS